MAEPLNGTDVHGLSTLARRWTPKSMVVDDSARALMECTADCIADVLNILIDAEQYLPIIYNPYRCRDEDVERILQMNGIDSSLHRISVEKARRLAVIAADMRAWRGAFRSHRSVAGALTGGPVIIIPYLLQRSVIDETSFDMIMLDEDDHSGISQVFVLGQGPHGSEYEGGELREQLKALAMPILDDVEITPCYALTAWRDGFAGWITDGSPELVASNVANEYEAVDLGPDVSSSSIQFIRSPTSRPETSVPETLHTTVWFKTGGATSGTFWELHAYADDSTPSSGSSYCARLDVGNGAIRLMRRNGAVYTELGSHRVNVPDGLSGGYHRLDLLVKKTSTNTKLRAYVDMDPTGWYTDPTVDGRPDGLRVSIGLRTSQFSTGRLRIGAITASRLETS